MMNIVMTQTGAGRSTLLAGVMAGVCAGIMTVAGITAPLAAQGSVSVLGLGYPTGELSTRALGTGGALSEIDSRSPLNPAALVIGPSGQAYMQYDPEFRTTQGPNSTSKTITARFPNVGFTVPINKRWVFGFSSSTLLDRSWSTSSTGVQTIGDDTATATQTFQSEGGINDLRVATAVQIGDRLRIGIGGHGFTGSNRVSFLERFADTLRYRSISQRTVVSYSGAAVSGGIEFDIIRTLNVAVDGRIGGTANMYANDTLVATAHIPDRYAASISFGGIPQTLLAARFAHENWSSLQALNTTGTRAVDANDISVGLESAGPKLGGDHAVLIRLGGRNRTLPFDLGTNSVHERSYGGGLGIPLGLAQLGGDRATFDFSILRSTRTAINGISERAYNVSFGLRIQP